MWFTFQAFFPTCTASFLQKPADPSFCKCLVTWSVGKADFIVSYPSTQQMSGGLRFHVCGLNIFFQALCRRSCCHALFSRLITWLDPRRLCKTKTAQFYPLHTVQHHPRLSHRRRSKFKCSSCDSSKLFWNKTLQSPSELQTDLKSLQFSYAVKLRRDNSSRTWSPGCLPHGICSVTLAKKQSRRVGEHSSRHGGR